MRGGVGFAGGADVAALHVADYQEAQVLGFGNQVVVGFYAFPEIFFEVGRLEFHDRDVRGDDFQDRGREFENRVDGGGEVVGVALRDWAGDFVGEKLVDRIDADADRRAFGVDG